jgi:hypothetical protein
MQMGKIDGITAALKLRKQNQDAVLIFCTGVQSPKPELYIIIRNDGKMSKISIDDITYISNLVVNILIYFAVYCLLFEKDLKERVFYFIVFFTIFAGVEIIFEFILSLIIGEGYQWER